MDNENKGFLPEEQESLFSDEIVKGLLIVAGIIAAFVLVCNVFFSSEETPAVEESTSQSVVATVNTTAPTGQNGPTAAPAVVQTTASVQDATQADANVTATASAQPGQKTKAEIIAIFNESANKVKTEAVKVVKNFENRNHNQEKLVLPSALEGMAADLMDKYMVDDTVPIEYPTKEDIVANYPVPGESWSSQLTQTEVAEAVCNDTGSEYEITLKLNSTKDPEPGIGTAKAFDCITPSEVSASAPAMVEEFSTEYYDCVVKCKIDKATGRTIWSNYSSPVIIRVVVNMGIAKIDAQVGMTFEKDYTITY